MPRGDVLFRNIVGEGYALPNGEREPFTNNVLNEFNLHHRLGHRDVTEGGVVDATRVGALVGDETNQQ